MSTSHVSSLICDQKERKATGFLLREVPTGTPCHNKANIFLALFALELQRETWEVLR